MTTKDTIEGLRGVDRRKFLAGLGTGAAAGLAGCGQQEGTPTGTTTGTQEGTPAGTPTTGGKPVIGMAVAPSTLNLYQGGSVYEFFIIDRVYDYGTRTHPGDQSFIPWMFTDWTLKPENAGTDKPTISATLRNDLKFHDGKDLTAQDYKFTVNFMKDQEPTGSLTAAAHKKVDKVNVVDDHNVEIFLTEKEQRWFTNILGFPIVPQHIWKNVDDFTKYSPRKSDEGVVGAGPWKLDKFSWENWFELVPAYDTYPPANADGVDWISDGAPFVDRVRFEVFGSQNQMEQQLLQGNIDAGFVAGGVTVNTAQKAQNKQSLTVHQNQDDGYNHISYNLRRVPFDDVAFRQFLNKIFDKTWVVEEPYSGIAAVEGDYVVIPELDKWRPPGPDELAGQDYQSQDRFDPVSMPDLSFPGDAGSFNLTGDALKSARDFLVNHQNAKHDYSFGEGKTDLTSSPEGKELYVNGKHFNEAHTNNAGEGGQGPIVFDFQPPQEDIYQSRYGQQLTGLMKKLGIPTRARVKTINSQIPQIYNQEDFDMFAMGWSLGVNVTHLSSLYSSEGADLEGNKETGHFNPMAYTNADNLIEQDRQLMNFDKRYPFVKQICAKIYNDSPTNITDVSKLLEPTNKKFTGWIGGLGTVVTEHSIQNLRKSQ